MGYIEVSLCISVFGKYMTIVYHYRTILQCIWFDMVDGHTTISLGKSNCEPKAVDNENAIYRYEIDNNASRMTLCGISQRNNKRLAMYTCIGKVCTHTNLIYSPKGVYVLANHLTNFCNIHYGTIVVVLSNRNGVTMLITGTDLSKYIRSTGNTKRFVHIVIFE